MFELSNQRQETHSKQSGFKIILILCAIVCVLSLLLFFVYARSEKELTKSFAKMQEVGKTLSIEGCANENMQWFQSCQAMTELCNQSISKMMRVCLANGDKEAQCDQYGDSIYGTNFGAQECQPYYSKKTLKKACADTYQAIADYCKAVRKFR